MGVAAMKKVIAKRWLNVEGKWHRPNETFAVKTLAGIPSDAVEVVADEPEAVAEKPEKAEEPAANEPEEETAKGATRRRNSRK